MQGAVFRERQSRGKMLAMNCHTFAAARKKREALSHVVLVTTLEPTGDIRGAEKGTLRHSV